MKKIAVVGGGISGLAAAQRLQEFKDKGEDIEVVLFEKDDRLGGVIDSDKRDGYLLEGGPDCFVSTKPWCVEMSDKLGISDDLLNTNDAEKGTTILTRGKLQPLPDGVMMIIPTKFWPFVTSKLFSWPAKIRMGMDLFIPKKKDPDADESLESFIMRRLGKEALDKLAEPLVAGIHAGDPKTMSLKASFPRFLEQEAKYGSLIKAMLAAKKFTPPPRKPGARRLSFFTSFKHCMTELTEAVAGSLKDVDIRKGSEVASVKKNGVSFTVSTKNGGEEQFDAVILTAPSYDVSTMLRGFDQEVETVLDSIPYSSSATISLAYDMSNLPRKPKGFGFLVPSVEKRKIMASTYSSIKWPGRAPEGKFLIRCFVGGPKSQQYVDLSDRELEELAVKELKDIIGLDAKPEFSRVFRWYKGMPSYIVGHLERVEGMMKRMDEMHKGMYITGGAYFGVGIGDCINNGWIAADKAFDHVK